MPQNNGLDTAVFGMSIEIEAKSQLKIGDSSEAQPEQSEFANFTQEFEPKVLKYWTRCES